MSDSPAPGEKEKSRLLTLLSATEDGHFAFDTIRNTFWFCVIGLAALGLQSFVGWTEGHGGNAILVWLLTGVEYAVLIADVIWFLSRLIVVTYKVVMRANQEIIDFKNALKLLAVQAGNSADGGKH